MENCTWNRCGTQRQAICEHTKKGNWWNNHHGGWSHFLTMLVPDEHLLQACEFPQFPAAMTQIHCKRKTMEMIKSVSSWEVCLVHISRSSHERNLKYPKHHFQESSRFFSHRLTTIEIRIYLRNPMCWASPILHSLNNYSWGWPSFPKRSFKHRFN